MRAIKFLFFFSVCIANFLSCSSVPKHNNLYVDLTDSARLVLLPTEGIEKDIDMVHFFSAEFGGRSYFLNAWVKADKNALEIVLFNEMGTGMGELSYRNGSVNFSSTVIPRSATSYIKPEFIIADFQLCFYDPILLEKTLNEIGLVFEIWNGSRFTQRRRILSGDEVIIEINKTANSVKLVNHLRRYAYTLEGDFSDFQ